MQDLSRIAGSVLLGGEGPHRIATRLCVNHLAMELPRKQVAFVDQDSGRRTETGDQQVRRNARVVLMPHPPLHGGFEIGSIGPVVGAGSFVAVAVVAVLHHKVDSARTRSVVIV